MRRLPVEHYLFREFRTLPEFARALDSSKAGLKARKDFLQHGPGCLDPVAKATLVVEIVGLGKREYASKDLSTPGPLAFPKHLEEIDSHGNRIFPIPTSHCLVVISPPGLFIGFQLPVDRGSLFFGRHHGDPPLSKASFMN